MTNTISNLQLRSQNRNNIRGYSRLVFRTGTSKPKRLCLRIVRIVMIERAKRGLIMFKAECLQTVCLRRVE